MTEHGVPENLEALVIEHAQGEEGSLEKLCFELGNKVYEHFRKPGNTWERALSQIQLVLKNAIKNKAILNNKEHLKAMVLDFELLKATLTKYETLPEQLLTRENTYKEISLEYCDQLLEKCTTEEQRTRAVALKDKIIAK